ncbi:MULTISPECIES: hypothetical protein [Klebsiella/Raoultella group]|nr:MULTISPECIES: hypothetical protein [Klebsiella/Raoultella group]MBZ7344308.1 hypothetical protein [Klebsiella grimontii]UYB56705.1 hypothetical protein N6B35_26190 [Klebsiella michiganensis]
MEKRIVFYDFETPYNQEQISKRLIENQFTKDANSGFNLQKINNSGIYFRHIKKIINIDTVVTPFGEKYENTTITYATNEVKITDKSLHIINPSRSLTPFRTDLLKSLGFQCTISNKNIELSSLLLSLREKNINITLTDIELTTYDLFKDARVKMVISSNSDLVSKAESYLNDIKSKITKIGFSLLFDDEDYFIEIGCKGTLKISGDLIEDKLEYYIINDILTLDT